MPQHCHLCSLTRFCNVSGTLYRESGVVSGITNRRWAALYPHSVATFRQEATSEPSKVWPLSSRCQLSKIKCKEFMVREKHTSTIWALAAGHYDRKQMVCLTKHLSHLAICCLIDVHAIEASKACCTFIAGMSFLTGAALCCCSNLCWGTS